jgi:hypothetical protein
VIRLLYLRRSSNTAAWSALTSFSVNSTPRASRIALMAKQGVQPGWVKSITFFCSLMVPRLGIALWASAVAARMDSCAGPEDGLFR